MESFQYVYIKIFLILSLFQACKAIRILEGPSSILVPVMETAVFECKAHCPEACIVDWTVNGSSTLLENQRTPFINKGFIFPVSYPQVQTVVDGVYTSTLSVIASVLVNNTEIFCVFEKENAPFAVEESGVAILLVLSEVILKPNPSLTIQSTLLLLKWSPPYLWPGQRIKYYKVLTTTIKNNTTIYDVDIINATYSYSVVIHELFQPDWECTEYYFVISAINNSDGTLESFTAVGRYLQGPEEFGTPSLDFTVYFTANLTPVVRISLQSPPKICSYQEMNYTFIMKAVNNSNQSDTTQFGPFHHRGNGTVKLDIMSEKLKVNEEYTVQLVLVTNKDSITFFNHSFDTYFQGFKISDSDTKPCSGKRNDQIYHYKIAAYVCGCIILLILLLLSVFVFFIITHYNYWNQCRRAKTTTKRAHDAMVHNPIYSGPVYESVRSELRTLSVERSSSTPSSNPCHSPSPNNNTSALQEKGNCYVDPPSRPQAVAVVAVQTSNQHTEAIHLFTTDNPVQLLKV